MPSAMMTTAALLFTLLAARACGSPLNWFVSPGGSDSASGLSPAAAFATPSRALAALAAAKAANGGACGGDATIFIAAGTYYLGAPLLLDAAHTCGAGAATRLVGDGARAAGGAGGGTVLSAGVPLAGWVRNATGVWSAPAPAPAGARMVRALYAAGAQPPLARRLLARTPIMTALEVGAWGVKFAPGDRPPQPPAALVQSAELVLWHNWVNTQNKIAAVNATAITSAGVAGDDVFNAGGLRWALQNVPDVGALAAGQFFVAAGSVVYRGLPGEDPTAAGGLVLVAELLPEALQVAGTAAAPVTGVLVANLTIAHTAAALEEQCMHDGCGGQSNSEAASAAVHVSFADGAAFDGVEITGAGGYGLWLDVGSTSCAVHQCLLHDLGQGGVRVGNGDNSGAPASAPAHSNAVQDTVITDAGHVVPAGTGVLAQECANTTITHNHIHHLRYTAVSTGWTWGYMADSDVGQTVSFNHLHDIFLGELSDGGCIYNLGRSPGTLIDNNLCHDSLSFNYGGWGIYTDEGSSNVTIRNNIAYNTKDAVFHQHYGTDNLIENNVWAFGSSRYCDESAPGAICDNSALRNSQHPVGQHDAGVNSSYTFRTNIVLMGGDASTAPWVVNNTRIVRTLGPTLGVANFTYANNVYWSNVAANPATALVFGASGADLDFAAWQALGKDATGRIADPQFTDALGLDFTLQPGSPALAMGFQPIDMSTVGVRSGPFKGM